MNRFLLELDCLRVINVAKRGDNPLCDFGNILKDVVRVVNVLNFCGFSHVLLVGNVLAHVLAKMAISYNSIAVIGKGLFPCVSQTACVDLPFPVTYLCSLMDFPFKKIKIKIKIPPRVY